MGYICKKFVLKFVANNTQMKTNEEFNDKFRTVFMQKIKDKYPGTIVKEYVYPVHLDMSDIVPETDDDVNNDNME